MIRLVLITLALVFCAPFLCAPSDAQRVAEPLRAEPLRVVLIPADGGAEDGTRADFAPVFNAVSRMTGVRFDLRVSQSYAAAVEAMCSGAADIAFLGPVTYVQARDRGCVELLAVAVDDNKPSYHSGIFVSADSPFRSLADLKGARMAFGDINSATSFIYPMSMLMDAGLRPVEDFKAIRLTGSHANSLAALTQGQADAAALSFESFERALQKKAVNAGSVRLLARSAPIPNPPLVMNTRLPAGVKAGLRQAFDGVATAPGVKPDMIRGYGGKRVDRYDTAFPDSAFDDITRASNRIDNRMKAAILQKASQRMSAAGH